MGNLGGHVAHGFAFLAIGLWHLLSHIKFHSLHPNSYTSPPWFPSSKIRYIELFLIMVGTSMSMAMELVISPGNHQPFDVDGTIPSSHLHNFEHATISLAFFTYAVLAIVLDRIGCKSKYGLTLLVAAIAFGQELLLFHLHSADHMGVEGQYHLLLQLVILVSFITTLMGIGWPKSFLVSFVRSASIFFQGAWLILLGHVLWTPEFIPKECYINLEEDHQVVRCHGEEALHRAKSLANLQFSWFLIGISIFSVSLYLGLGKTYGDHHQKVEYSPLTRELSSLSSSSDQEEDVEGQMQLHKHGESKSFISIGKPFASIDIERL